ncbi:MAG: YchF/TatD family DNA exonuclease [Acidobacteriia bacterium]|nr:YchF/TatD family DNA exonuclease [Terriglobia bacterium]
MFIDSHAHLEFPQYNGQGAEVLARAQAAGVERILAIGSGSGPGTLDCALQFAERYDWIFATVGIHPHESRLAADKDFVEIRQLAGRPRVLAIGEIGLDYYYDHSPRDVQREVFIRQIRIAKDLGLPIVVHSRDAEQDTLEILRHEWRSAGLGGILHCFTGSLEMARGAIEMGFLVSFSGIITFKKSQSIREVARSLPNERVLIETDSPFLAPEPHRGKTNEPAFVAETARALAEVKGLTTEDIARITRFNFNRFFKLPDPSIGRRTVTYKIRHSIYVNLTTRCTADCVFCARLYDPVVSGYYLGLKENEEPGADEIIGEIGDPTQFEEVVFCGYGEPTLRLDVIKEVSRAVKSKGGRTRIDTIGHANLIHKRNVVPELVGLIDHVSISLNAADAQKYEKLCRTEFPGEAFAGMLEFTRECVRWLPRVTLSVVRVPNLDVEACKRMADEIGAVFRIREYDLVG